MTSILLKSTLILLCFVLKLTPPCCAEIDVFPTDAKGIELKEYFENTTTTCQDKLNHCLTTAVVIKELINTKQYCAGLDYSDAKTGEHAEGCLVVTGGCTEAEYTSGVTLACNASGINVFPTDAKGIELKEYFEKTTTICQDKLNHCLTTAVVIKGLINTKQYCAGLKYSDAKTGEHAEGCLVVTGGCTKAEYTSGVTLACSASSLLASGLLSFVLVMVAHLIRQD